MKQLPGTWAEQTLAPEDHPVLMPPDMSFLDAASLGMGALVPGNMYKLAKLPEGTRCLVLGASGGLGTVMLQLLRSHKASQHLHVTAVCSAANAELVRRLGADEAVDYRKGPLGEQLARAEEFDVVFDFVGGAETERDAAALLRQGGQFITATGPMQGIGDRKLSCCEWTGWACSLTRRLACQCGCSKYKYEFSAAQMPVKSDAFNLVAVELGARAEIALEVPFAEKPLREALKKVTSRTPGGKVVINFELESSHEGQK